MQFITNSTCSCPWQLSMAPQQLPAYLNGPPALEAIPACEKVKEVVGLLEQALCQYVGSCRTRTDEINMDAIELILRNQHQAQIIKEHHLVMTVMQVLADQTVSEGAEHEARQVVKFVAEASQKREEDILALKNKRQTLVWVARRSPAASNGQAVPSKPPKHRGSSSAGPQVRMRMQLLMTSNPELEGTSCSDKVQLLYCMHASLDTCAVSASTLPDPSGCAERSQEEWSRRPH